MITRLQSPAPFPAWPADLRLRFERAGQRTILTDRRHHGPLVVQKGLYPEGQTICHAILVHPPGGIAGGDTLSLEGVLGPGAHAVLSTPAATKWYKTSGPPAGLTTLLELGPGARLDYLPQENILFRGCRARNRLTVRLHPTAGAVGWDMTVLGRSASGERWDLGEFRSEMLLETSDGIPLWSERAVLTGDSPLLRSRQALAGFRVFATLWAAGPALSIVAADALDQRAVFTTSRKCVALSGAGLRSRNAAHGLDRWVDNRPPFGP